MNQVITTERTGAVLTIRFTNPGKRNALSPEFRTALAEALEVARSDSAIRVVYMTGSGSAFCSGGDLKMLQAACEPWAVYERFRETERWLLPLIHLDKPVIVGVNGIAVGGGIGLALSGDIIIAAESAKFMPGFFRLGVVPDLGTMYTLPRLIGLSRAKQFLFSGETCGPQEAREMGLVAKVVPDGELDAECMRRAQAIAEGAATVMGVAKRIMSRSFETGLQEMFLLETLGQALAMSSSEFRERLAGLLAAAETKAAQSGRGD